MDFLYYLLINENVLYVNNSSKYLSFLFLVYYQRIYDWLKLVCWKADVDSSLPSSRSIKYNLGWEVGPTSFHCTTEICSKHFLIIIHHYLERSYLLWHLCIQHVNGSNAVLRTLDLVHNLYKLFIFSIKLQKRLYELRKMIEYKRLIEYEHRPLTL